MQLFAPHYGPFTAQTRVTEPAPFELTQIYSSQKRHHPQEKFVEEFHLPKQIISECNT